MTSLRTIWSFMMNYRDTFETPNGSRCITLMQINWPHFKTPPLFARPAVITLWNAPKVSAPNEVGQFWHDKEWSRRVCRGPKLRVRGTGLIRVYALHDFGSRAMQDNLASLSKSPNLSYSSPITSSASLLLNEWANLKQVLLCSGCFNSFVFPIDTVQRRIYLW